MRGPIASATMMQWPGRQTDKKNKESMGFSHESSHLLWTGRHPC